MIWQTKRIAKTAEYYDQVYKDSIEYSLHWKQSYYFEIWEQVIKSLPFVYSNPLIYDLGCGTGQLTAMIYNYGYSNILGFDFSTEAIERGRKQFPEIKKQLFVQDIERQYSADCIVCCETLEHLQNDIETLKLWQAESTLSQNSKTVSRRVIRNPSRTIP